MQVRSSQTQVGQLVRETHWGVRSGGVESELVTGGGDESGGLVPCFLFFFGC